ncbi:MAG: hypothetical protein RLO12_13275 [Fulvivirga sp.]|uniref:hypothetical protein n=1 Tax=Fulvivirga sp. TaxID=1931237 RepID=UPI0033016B64
MSYASGYADYGKAYYFKCEIITSDTTLVGYYIAPFELISDSMMVRLKQSNEYLTRTMLDEWNKSNNRSDIDVFDFVHLYEFPDPNQDLKRVSAARFVSTRKTVISKRSIKELKYQNVVIYESWGYGVSSSIERSDTVWMNKNPTFYEIDKRDGCCPQAFFIHDGSSEYEELINKIISTEHFEEGEFKTLYNQLRSHKVIAVTLCFCN